MKKLVISLILAVILVIALTVPTLAAPPKTIEIDTDDPIGGPTLSESDGEAPPASISIHTPHGSMCILPRDQGK